MAPVFILMASYAMCEEALALFALHLVPTNFIG